MIRYECDKCGAPLSANDPRRFIVKIEVYAAAGHVELDPDPGTDAPSQVSDLIEELSQANPDDVEDQTYRCLRLDVCDTCRKKLLAKPLG